MNTAVTNFRCHKFVAKVNKQKGNDMKNFICNQCGEKLLSQTPKISKLVD